MKGVVFTDFLEMVEGAHSHILDEQILADADPESGGAYTAVGTYDYMELGSMGCHLGRRTDTPVPELLHTFGGYMFGRFLEGYPQFFEGETSPLDFLPKVDGYIHGEVRKLYPDAELPVFDSERPDAQTLIMTYESSRPLAQFAEGLIAAAIDHFEKPIDLVTEDLSDGKGTKARFTLTEKE